jgi:hypothetical protein
MEKISTNSKIQQYQQDILKALKNLITKILKGTFQPNSDSTTDKLIIEATTSNEKLYTYLDNTFLFIKKKKIFDDEFVSEFKNTIVEIFTKTTKSENKIFMLKILLTLIELFCQYFNEPTILKNQEILTKIQKFKQIDEDNKKLEDFNTLLIEIEAFFK